MNNKSRVLIALALALAVVGAFALAETLLIMTRQPIVVTPGKAAIGGPFTLVTTDGRSVSDQTYRGKWLLIYFGYTNCPDACPTALNSISVALEKLGQHAGKLQPLFITVDPQRDTPSVMADYLKSFDSRIVGLSGAPGQIDSVLKEYRIYAAAQKSETGGDYPVAHSAYLYLMDPRRQFVSLIHGSDSGEEIATRLRKEMAHPNTGDDR